MPVVKLNKSHAAVVGQLLQECSESNNNDDTHINIKFTLETFCEFYLGELTSFHAYGFLNRGKLTSLVAFYESKEEPAWYYALCYATSTDKSMQKVLDAVISYNELHGRLKFYTRILSNPTIIRGTHWSGYNNIRYDYVDELVIPSRCKCFYRNIWEMLFFRQLEVKDLIIRCNFLKQEHRTTIPIGGNI